MRVCAFSLRGRGGEGGKRWGSGKGREGMFEEGMFVGLDSFVFGSHLFGMLLVESFSPVRSASASLRMVWMGVLLAE